MEGDFSRPLPRTSEGPRFRYFYCTCTRIINHRLTMDVAYNGYSFDIRLNVSPSSTMSGRTILALFEVQACDHQLVSMVTDYSINSIWSQGVLFVQHKQLVEWGGINLVEWGMENRIRVPNKDLWQQIWSRSCACSKSTDSTDRLNLTRYLPVYIPRHQCQY